MADAVQSLGISSFGTMSVPTSIFASTRERVQVPITLGAGQGVVKRGTCLGIKTEDGNYYKYNSAAADGTENFVGILGVEIDTTDGDAKAYMFIAGDFIKDNLFAYGESALPGSGAPCLQQPYYCRAGVIC